MPESQEKIYEINITPRVLELLGPSLYTNIYYVLAELIANAYDADANNVYIIEDEDKIIVEDDGTGMSYSDGDIGKYLDVAVETRTGEKDEKSASGKRNRIGRKGIGKLAALSVSENVSVMSIKNGEKSGFILSRHVKENKQLKAIKDEKIYFQKVTDKGTAIIMINPEYKLHKSPEAIRNNLLRIFPLVSSDFKIHILTSKGNITIENFNKEMAKELCGVITLGEDHQSLLSEFEIEAEYKDLTAELLKKRDSKKILIKMKNKAGEEKEYELEIKGWIGVYKTTTDRKKDPSDFPDNFISIHSNGKLGEYNILPFVGKNKLQEVYVVGQLHADLFEKTELPDIALSNRQGYKSDDPRYEELIKYVRDNLLPEIVNMRAIYATRKKDLKEKIQQEQRIKREEELREKVKDYTHSAAEIVTKRIKEDITNKSSQEIKNIIVEEMNKAMPLIGLKTKIDSEKKKILISQTRKDKDLSDIIYKMLCFNGIPSEDIIYTNCDDEECRVPNGLGVFDYLRKFFVDSYSQQKIFLIYVTSDDMAKSWGAVSEVGAGWITENEHEIFNIYMHRPQSPLNVASEWQTSKREEDDIKMDTVEFDKFIVKIRSICSKLGYVPKEREDNQRELKRYVFMDD